MLTTLYHASFFLYEISFLALALALGTQSELMRKLTSSLHLPPLWLLPAASAVLLLACALLHFYVYHYLSPRYLLSSAHEDLIRMYILKTISMASILLAGLCLTLGCGWYYKRTTQ